MGFWDTAKDITKGLGKGFSEQANKAKDLADEWQHKDRAFIVNKYKNGNAIEKVAANKVAKDKGWK